MILPIDDFIQELKDYGPMKVRLYDGSVYYITEHIQNTNRFKAQFLRCTNKTYQIRFGEIKEILD